MGWARKDWISWIASSCYHFTWEIVQSKLIQTITLQWSSSFLCIEIAWIFTDGRKLLKMIAKLIKEKMITIKKLKWGFSNFKMLKNIWNSLKSIMQNMHQKFQMNLLQSIWKILDATLDKSQSRK